MNQKTIFEKRKLMSKETTLFPIILCYGNIFPLGIFAFFIAFFLRGKIAFITLYDLPEITKKYFVSQFKILKNYHQFNKAKSVLLKRLELKSEYYKA